MIRPLKPKPLKIGRPSLGGKGPATRVEIKLAPADRTRWQAAADKQGQTLSEWLREAAELALVRGSTR